MVRQVEDGGDEGQAEQEEDDGPCTEEARKWLAKCCRRKISHTNWQLDGRRKPTECKLFPGRKHVHGKCDFNLDLLPSHPFPRRGECGSHLGTAIL